MCLDVSGCFLVLCVFLCVVCDVFFLNLRMLIKCLFMIMSDMLLMMFSVSVNVVFMLLFVF